MEELNGAEPRTVSRSWESPVLPSLSYKATFFSGQFSNGSALTEQQHHLDARLSSTHLKLSAMVMNQRRTGLLCTPCTLPAQMRPCFWAAELLIFPSIEHTGNAVVAGTLCAQMKIL